MRPSLGQNLKRESYQTALRGEYEKEGSYKTIPCAEPEKDGLTGSPFRSLKRGVLQDPFGPSRSYKTPLIRLP